MKSNLGSFGEQCSSVLSERLRWLAEFEARHGRRLRVLHIGNIANNAYLNAKFLRQVGVDADVMSQDYYHVMACPEWEELEITQSFGDDNAPRFSPLDLGSYRRPSWFIQGTLSKSVEMIRDKFVRNAIFSRNGSADSIAPAATLEDVLHSIKFHAGALNQNVEGKLARVASELSTTIDTILRAELAVTHQHIEKACDLLQSNLHKTVEVLESTRELRAIIASNSKVTAITRVRRMALRAWRTALQNQQLRAIYGRSGLKRLRRSWRGSVPELASIGLPASEPIGSLSDHGELPDQVEAIFAATAVSTESAGAYAGWPRVDEAVTNFAADFPDRLDKLTVGDVLPYMGAADLFRVAFEPYDIVQCYATHPIFGYLAGNKPYVGYEHGTLRTFTMGDDPLHRLTALGYRRADHVFITNGDCLEYAQRLGITRFSPMIHPVDVEQHREHHGIDPREMKERLNADVLLFCPLRHDWAIKGTDVYLRALPLLRAKIGSRLVLVLTRWGQELDASRALIASSGCSDLVIWTPPLSRITMIKLMQAADVVFDQIALPHFGASGPQALAVGTPVISSYVPESTAWIVDQPAPILPAFTPNEVVEAVLKALDPKWRAHFNDRARQWVNAEHHQSRLVNEHLRVYQEILERRQDGST